MVSLFNPVINITPCVYAKFNKRGELEASITIWTKVQDHDGQRKAYQRISYFIPSGRVKYKLHLLWINRNHYHALLHVPHDA
ncbi:MAG: hypothetical protein HN507_00285 [Flavobacteriaceae bacterium]|nr:hypothetical protein [Flavobacteriaceae bacterium]